ncbi:MAG: response regulator [Daejeonella sp.]
MTSLREPGAYLVLMDVSKPVKDGFQTCNWLRVNYPGVKVIALSVMNDEHANIGVMGIMGAVNSPFNVLQPFDPYASLFIIYALNYGYCKVHFKTGGIYH